MQRLALIPASLSLVLSLVACGPEIIDTDRDGIENHIEEELGTDPFVADTDGDGFDDGVEWDTGTDPLLCWDLPEGWPDCRLVGDTVPGTNWELDSVVPDVVLRDQFGEELALRRYYGMVVVLDVSAAWCGPCAQASPKLQALHEAREDQGFSVIQVMVEDEPGVNAETQTCSDWAEEFELSFPVTSNDTYTYQEAQINEVYARLNISGHEVALPYYVVLDREHKLVFSTNLEGELAAVVDGLL
jgi:thiol-disulfide isomerase/thioredoxin